MDQSKLLKLPKKDEQAVRRVVRKAISDALSDEDGISKTVKDRVENRIANIVRSMIGGNYHSSSTPLRGKLERRANLHARRLVVEMMNQPVLRVSADTRRRISRDFADAYRRYLRRNVERLAEERAKADADEMFKTLVKEIDDANVGAG